MKTFQFSIKTPVESVINENVVEVSVDTDTGRMCVLAGHADLTGSILFSKVKIVLEHGEKEFFIKNGVMHIDRKNNATSILCMRCDTIEEITTASIEEYLAFVTQQLANKESLSEYQVSFLEKESFALRKQKEVLKK